MKNLKIALGIIDSETQRQMEISDKEKIELQIESALNEMEDTEYTPSFLFID